MFDEDQYKYFQKRINENILYKYFWTFWGNYAFVIFVLVGLWAFFQPELRDNWQAVLGLSILSFVMTRGFAIALINQFVKRARPYQKYSTKPEETKFFSFRDSDHDSFPSRHTAAYFSVASVVFIFHPILGGILLAVSIIAGIGRVIMGWHWPTDVLAGAVLGLISGYLTYHFLYSLFFTLT
jgi:membrane-associated phospholipid phosphatase